MPRPGCFAHGRTWSVDVLLLCVGRYTDMVTLIDIFMQPSVTENGFFSALPG